MSDKSDEELQRFDNQFFDRVEILAMGKHPTRWQDMEDKSSLPFPNAKLRRPEDIRFICACGNNLGPNNVICTKCADRNDRDCAAHKAKVDAALKQYDENKKDDGDREPFHFLLDPGTATVKEIAELFSAMAKLARMIGGCGIRFNVDEVRTVGE